MKKLGTGETQFSVLTIIEVSRFTFTPNGKREFVPRDQVFPRIGVYCLLLLHKLTVVSSQFYP